MLVAILGLAGCPSNATTTRKPPAKTAWDLKCPDPDDCIVTNGRRLTGVVVDDAPATVQSIQLQTGKTFRFR
jgi:hypothetical protein